MKARLVLYTSLIVSVKAEESHGVKSDSVPSHWRTIAIGLAIVLAIILFITVVKRCLPRWLNSKKVHSISEEDGKISIISSNRLKSAQVENGKQGSPKKTDLKRLSLDINAAKVSQERSPSISVHLATPSSEDGPKGVGVTSPISSDLVPCTPPPPPPETLLWVPSTARRRSVSLRGDSDEEKDQKSLCSYCGGTLSQSQSASTSPIMRLERKRSVTFNQNVEEIHVLSNEPKVQRSRSPSLLLSGPFYAR